MHRQHSRRPALTATLITATFALAAAGLSCGDGATDPITPGAPAALVVVSGDDQVDTVGTELAAPLVVRVLDENGLRVPNQILNFVVTAGGGSVFAGSALTNADGEARERWTLGKVAADSQRLEARAVDATTGAAIVFGTFRATAVAGPATKLKKASADSGSATIGTNMAVKPSVLVTDQYDNPVSGTTVTFTVVSGGGSVTGESQVTGASGIATVGAWTLGATAGANTLSATSAGLTGSPITFFATGVAASQLALTTPASGAASGAAFTTQPVVAFRDASGQTVAATNGVTVTMTVSGNGRPVGTATATAMNGVATFSNVGIHGTAGVAYTLTFSAPGVTDASQTITPTPGTATQLVLTTSAGSAASGAAFGTQPVVAIRDEAHNTITTDNGTVVTMTVSGATLVGTATATASNGVATFSNAGIRGAVGEKTLTWSASGLASAIQSITLTPGAAATVTVSPSSATLLSLEGETRQLSAVAKDAEGNTASGPLAWVSSDSDVATVSASGLVSAVDTGTATITATADGISGTATITVAAISFTALSAGWAFHTCGVTSSGKAYCWGRNTSGQLGNGGRTDRLIPGAVAGGMTFEIVEAGGDFSCGLTAVGAAFCWGANNDGQLGTGIFDGDSPNPAAVTGGHAFVDLVAGYDHACGLTSEGDVWCWGDNFYGELGDSTTLRRSSPVAAASEHSFTSLIAGQNHTCGVTSARDAYCWGSDRLGQVSGTITCPPADCPSSASGRTTPVLVPGGHRFKRLAGGLAHTCGITDAGAFCWGGNGSGELGNGTESIGEGPVAVEGGSDFVSLAAGERFTCGLKGSAGYCWGVNHYGQLGDGTMVKHSTPVAVQVGPLTGMAAGGEHACGVMSSGAAYCWGRNDFGQLGDGTRDNRSAPVAVVRQ